MQIGRSIDKIRKRIEFGDQGVGDYISWKRTQRRGAWGGGGRMLPGIKKKEIRSDMVGNY